MTRLPLSLVVLGALSMAVQAGESVVPKSKQDAPVPSEQVPGTGLIKPKVDPDPKMQKVPPDTDPANKDVIKPPANVEPQ
jgi:hypothetical protein